MPFTYLIVRLGAGGGGGGNGDPGQEQITP